MTNILGIVNAMKEERARIEAAIRVLERDGGDGPGNSRKPGRRGRPSGRKLSAAAKKRISAGMKARWAKAKKAGRSSL